MHGSSQGTPVTLGTFGGLVTLASADSLPEGASPRLQDNDYLVGQTKTRDGLTSQYSFSGASVGPSTGAHAVDASTGGVAWVNPTNVLLNTGVYASVALGPTGSTASATSAGTSSGGGVAWTTPENIDSNVSFASVSLSPGGGTYAPSDASGGVSNVAGPSNTNPPDQNTDLSGFASVPATSCTVSVNASGTITASSGAGQIVVSYNKGLGWVPIRSWNGSFSATISVPITGITNLNQISLRISAVAGCSPSGFVNVVGNVASWSATVAGGSQLTAQTLSAAITGLTVPTGATITGFGLSFNADQTGIVPDFSVALSVGTEQPSFTLTNSPATYTAGGDGDLWGADWTADTLSSLVANFTASSSGITTINANTLVATVYYSVVAPHADGIDVTGLGFSIPSSDTPLGFAPQVRAYSSVAGAVLKLQMLKAGVPTGTTESKVLTTTPTVYTFGGSNELFGASWAYSDVNNTDFGVRLSAEGGGNVSIYAGYTTVTTYLSAAQTNFDFITTFTAQDGTIKNVSLDAIGNLWVENVSTNPGVLTLATTGIAPSSFAVGVNGEDVEYLAFNDGLAGSDVPRQYTANWIDRITQVGPGAAPVFTPLASTADTYAISSITQPPANSDITNPAHISVLLQSSGPSSTAPGNVITVFYSPSFYSGAPHPEAEDAGLVAQFNAGQTVIVYLSGTSFGAGTYVVTSVGNAQPPGVAHYRYYFTVQALTSNYQLLKDTAGQYQRSLATMTTTVPVPGLEVGNVVTIAGSSVAAYDTTWTISQTLNSGAMVITQTAVVSGVATYSYALSSGVAPAVGELVTITNTTNANGLLNLTNATIVTASGGSTGTFTLNVAAPDAVAATEQGQATTAGTVFAFDPGIATLGTGSNPILGNATGGTLTFAGSSGQFIGTGTRQGTVFFITRNGYWTAPAPPGIFTVPSNTVSLAVTKLPIGPPNVIARGITLTEPGQGGVPGANFFCTPQPVNYTVAGQTYTSSSFIVWDNTSTSTSLFFTDSVLLQRSEAVDVQGFNLFNLIEIGDPGWIVQYDSRNFYGLCRNKVQNFVNLSFDGGFYPGGQITPLGWSQPDQYGSLLNSPVFGNSYYIKNTTVGTLATAGLISQTAFQDAYQIAILEPNTAYSVRVTARCPSGLTVGSLAVSLTAGGITYGTFTLPFASMTTSMATYEGTLLTTELPTIPPLLMLNVKATAIGAGADVEIDRVEPYPTAIPILTTTVYGSYANDFESVDAESGQVKFISENQQPVNGAIVLYDTLYALKESSMYSLRSQPNLEPAQWDEPEVAQRAGSCSINGYDFGEQWVVMACRNGVYLYEGGQPGKITQEIFQVWDAVNWGAKQSIWVKNDVVGRRLFVGVPLPTPNFWMPDAPVNSNPTSPNVILMMNYQGLDTGQEIKNAPQMHTTMFGTLNAIDMRRKWSIWQIPSPHAAIVKTATDQALYICNGRANSKVYALDPTNITDDGVAIDSRYVTYGFTDAQKSAQMPMLGMFRKRWGYFTANVSGSGLLTVTLYPNQLLGPTDSTTGYHSWAIPGGFTLTPVCLNDREASLNFVATRTYVELRGANFSVSQLTMYGKADVWNKLRGQK